MWRVFFFWEMPERVDSVLAGESSASLARGAVWPAPWAAARFGRLEGDPNAVGSVTPRSSPTL